MKKNLVLAGCAILATAEVAVAETTGAKAIQQDLPDMLVVSTLSTSANAMSYGVAVVGQVTGDVYSQPPLMPVPLTQKPKA